jgi:hypothetical protein
MQQDVNQLDEDLHNQSNVQSVKEFCCREQGLRDGVLGLVFPQGLLY